MNNLNNQNLALKVCTYSEFISLTKEATVSAITVCGDNLFHSLHQYLELQRIMHKYLPLNQEWTI